MSQFLVPVGDEVTLYFGSICLILVHRPFRFNWISYVDLLILVVDIVAGIVYQSLSPLRGGQY